MAKDPNNPEVVVKGSVQNNLGRPYPGMSPLETGLLYGGVSAASIGPLGLLVGLGAGIMAKRNRDSYLDAQAKFLRNTAAEHDEFRSDLADENKIADPDEQRMLKMARRMETDGWARLNSGDGTGRDLIDQANTIMRGVVQGDISQRKQEESNNLAFQRDLIGTAAKGYREEYQRNMATFDQVDQQASRVLDLVSQPGFDPNKPLNKTILAELLSTGVAGFYKDAPDVLDAVTQGSNALRGIPILGQYAPDIVQAVTTAVKAGDFKLTPEDYNRIALNMKGFAQKYAQNKMGTLGDQARGLDSNARRLGAIPDDYSLADYISGGVKELRLVPVPSYKAPAANPPLKPIPPQNLLPPSSYAPNDIRGNPLWRNSPNRGIIRRPTN